MKKARWRKRREERRRSAQSVAHDKKRGGDRFLAPAPVVIPPDATQEQREALRFGSAGRPR